MKDTAYLTGIARQLRVLHTAKLLDDPALFSIRSLFAGLLAEGMLLWEAR